MPETIVEVSDLNHTFKGFKALEGVSFTIQSGSLHGFVGPNGAGKTTTLKIICTPLRPQSGEVRVFGHNVLTNVKAIRRQIGFMPDHFSMYRQMTVYEYLDFFGAAYGQSVAHRDRVIGDVLSLTDMDGRRDSLIHGLSRGMQQRVGLARVLINDPDLLLLDEPASGLDPRARIEMMEILRELRNMGKTVFISSHILSELGELCDSVTIIDRGEVKFSGPMSQLLSTNRSAPVYVLTLAMVAEETQEQLRSLPGVTQIEAGEAVGSYLLTTDPALIDANRLLRQVLDLGLSVVGFHEEKRHLNQAFMDLTTQGVR